MNCSTCKYRSNLFGFEKEVGLVQESHHDHVEGLGISCDLCDPECNGACELTNNQEKSNLVEGDYLEHYHDHEHEQSYQHEHNYHHHHSIYPNSKHPLGPLTLRLPNEDQILRKSIENN